MDSDFMESSAKQDPMDDNNHAELLLSHHSTIATRAQVVDAPTNTNLNNPTLKRNAPATVEKFEIPDSVEILDNYLQQGHVDANTKDREGRTLLLESIRKRRSDSFIMHLLNENFDPNLSDKNNDTPLHDVMTRPTSTIAYELLKRGANVNATSKQRWAPLHYAAIDLNLDAICLLLYYGADANVLSGEKKTPFMYSLSSRRLEIAELLINYHDNDCLNHVNSGCSALYYASCFVNPLAVQLFEMGTNINLFRPDDKHLLVNSLFYEEATLFKLIWARYDYDIILKSRTPFLINYFTYSRFSTTDWVDCLSIILNSPIASELVQCYYYYYYEFRCVETIRGPFFTELLRGFYKKKINLSQRLKFIYMGLHLGAKVNIQDIITAYVLYGFSDELDILIYFLEDDTIAIMHKYSKMICPLLPFILALEDEFDLKTAQVVLNWKFKYPPEDMLGTPHDWLGFFSRSCCTNLFPTDMSGLTSWEKLTISERLQCLPEFPSLFELSRNQARKFVRQTCRITKPYHFHDAVKNLNLPDYIKDVIRFKVPIYK